MRKLVSTYSVLKAPICLVSFETRYRSSKQSLSFNIQPSLIEPVQNITEVLFHRGNILPMNHIVDVFFTAKRVRTWNCGRQNMMFPFCGLQRNTKTKLFNWVLQVCFFVYRRFCLRLKAATENSKQYVGYTGLQNFN